MAGNYDEWTRARDDLVRSMKVLGFSEGLGDAIAGNLGSPKAMKRMTSYLQTFQSMVHETDIPKVY